MLLARLPEFLAHLGVSLRPMGRAMVGACPIHGGDKADGFYLYPEGHTEPGSWRCFTRGCQQKYRPTVLGAAWGILSAARNGFDGPAIPFREALDACCAFLGIEFDAIEGRPAWLEREGYARLLEALGTREPPKGSFPRSELLRFLDAPSPYFLGRGVPARLLEEFCVGDCTRAGRPLSGRAVVPVFDEGGEFAVGFTGRSVHPECRACGQWHPPGACVEFPKWRNRGLEAGRSLYGWWGARKAVRESRLAVLLEGPGDTWAARAAGVPEAMGLLGSSLSGEQQVQLESSGANTVLVLTNSDAAGRDGAARIEARLSRCFRVLSPPPPANDLMDMGPALASWLLPLAASSRRG